MRCPAPDPEFTKLHTTKCGRQDVPRQAVPVSVSVCPRRKMPDHTYTHTSHSYTCVHTHTHPTIHLYTLTSTPHSPAQTHTHPHLHTFTHTLMPRHSHSLTHPHILAHAAQSPLLLLCPPPHLPFFTPADPGLSFL